MILYVKMGTLPGQMLKALHLRTPPIVGQMVKFRDPQERYAKIQEAKVLEIRETGNGTMYVCERW